MSLRWFSVDKNYNEVEVPSTEKFNEETYKFLKSLSDMNMCVDDYIEQKFKDLYIEIINQKQLEYDVDNME